MPSSITYKAAFMRQAVTDLGQAIQLAATEGMEKVVAQAAEDARSLADWRAPGEQTETYPGGVTWEWTTTGMAAASIQGYVVPNKRLRGQSTQWTTSYRNGIPRQHIHATDDSITGNHQAPRHTIVGIVTMNIAYAPYLQRWEMEGAGQQEPVTVEVFRVMWSFYYVPNILKPAISAALDAVARRYT